MHEPEPIDVSFRVVDRRPPWQRFVSWQARSWRELKNGLWVIFTGRLWLPDEFYSSGRAGRLVYLLIFVPGAILLLYAARLLKSWFEHS